MNAALDPREVTAAQALAADVALGAEREPFDATLDRSAIAAMSPAVAANATVASTVAGTLAPSGAALTATATTARIGAASAAGHPAAPAAVTPPPPAPAWASPIASVGAGSSSAWPLRVLAVVALVALLPLAKPFLLPVVLAVLLAIVLSGPVRALQRAGLSEPVGALVVVCAVLLGVSAVIAALAEPAGAWMERAPANVAQLMQSLERLREAVPLLHAATGGAAAPAASGETTAIGETLKSEGLNLTRLVLEQATGFLIAAVSTFILLYFLLASQNWLVIRLMQRVRSRHARLHGLCIGRSAERDIAHFLLTMLMINVLLGIATGLALWALGLPNP
nr:AI-2E family transporter [Burkholderiaceae bacterium]